MSDPRRLERIPLISVVVAVFNAAETLQGCIDSVVEQTYPHKELVVIDGGSTDGSVEIIRKNSNKIAYWESKQDRGVYHAWNKALEHTRGDWICFLGADDYFWENDVLERVLPHLEAASARCIRVAYGQVAIVSAEGKLVETLGKPWERIEKHFHQDMAFPHTGTMHHRTLFETHGRFDESFRVAADYELLLRELKSRPAWFIPGVVTVGMRIGGISTVPLHALLSIQEVAKARRKNDVKGFSWWLFWRRSRALIRSLITAALGARTANLLIDYSRLLMGKRKKWTV